MNRAERRRRKRNLGRLKGHKLDSHHKAIKRRRAKAGR
jgi:hypothetical protein